MRPVRIGCSGWNYDDWRGRLYPEGMGTARWLRRYAEVFDTVEVNSTFYRLASRDAVARWVEQTPAELPVRRQGQPLPDPRPPAARHRARAWTASTSGSSRWWSRSKLGPVVWQLPPNFRRDDERLRRRSSALPPGRHCFEFRHPSWFAEPVYALLREHDAALVIGDHPSGRSRPTS